MTEGSCGNRPLDLDKARKAKLLNTVSGSGPRCPGRPGARDAPPDGVRSQAAALQRIRVGVTHYDFTEVGACECRTYSLWIVQGDPERSANRDA